jgi:DNA-binding MarR family transcriptional regulator
MTAANGSINPPRLVERSGGVGRPRLSRAAALAEIERLPRRGRGLVYVNARQLAKQLGCHRCTIGVILNDLERSHRLVRRRRKGRRGILLELTRLPTPSERAGPAEEPSRWSTL